MAMEPLTPAQLCRKVDLGALTFETTAELPDDVGVLGQDRALAAIDFGARVDHHGYNLFVIGAPGTGRHSILRHMLADKAASQPAPPDWVYVNNFELAHQPSALQLPPGKGNDLCARMAALIDDLRAAIPAVFESEEYRARRRSLEQSIKEHHEVAFEDLRKRANERQIALMQTPMGMAFAPLKDGQVYKPEMFEALPEDERKRIQSEIAALEKDLQGLVEQVPGWNKQLRDALRQLNEETATFAVVHAMADVDRMAAELPQLQSYVAAVRADLLRNVDAFRPPAEGHSQQIVLGQAMAERQDGVFRRYGVNVIVDNGACRGAPVVADDNPTTPFLVGRIEHLAQMGALVTDFGLIKAGSLHRANGGYLVLDARKVLANPYAWDALKRAIRSAEIRIETPGEMYGLVSTVTLQPEPIPLGVKVVLIGDHRLYYLLSQLDPEFAELFKVAADFEDVIDWQQANAESYARLIADIARREQLLPLSRDGVCRVVEHGARLADDAERLTLRISAVADLLRESDYWARQAGRDIVGAADVEHAIEAQIHRLDRIRVRSHESITREIMLIDTTGARVGQINALSVLDLGNFRFGRPSRITARVQLGTGKVVDIEREVELGGPLHSKGVLILSGFLGARFGRERPLALAASIVFEQSYGGVDGDSASSAELYVLLSALAEVPIKQSFAVTGSVNQHGDVQAIGGVNEKIEGFFDICRAKDLTGDQGVLIPRANVKHLMLRRDVVEAAATGRFQIYPIDHVDQGIALLTGLPAGERDGDGAYPPNSVNFKVDRCLTAFAEARRKYAGVAPAEAAKS